MPLIWHRVRAGEISPVKSEKVAQATRELSDEAANLVDRGIVEHLATLPWTRFLLVLSALIMEADPKAAEHRPGQQSGIGSSALARPTPQG